MFPRDIAVRNLYKENLKRYVKENPGMYVLLRGWPAEHESFHLTKFGAKRNFTKMNKHCTCCYPPLLKKIPGNIIKGLVKKLLNK